MGKKRTERWFVFKIIVYEDVDRGVRWEASGRNSSMKSVPTGGDWISGSKTANVYPWIPELVVCLGSVLTGTGRGRELLACAL